MIEVTCGNLLRADAEALVNTVNCVGVMGKGIALQFKQAWPEMFKAYQRACRAGEVHLGRMHIWETGQMLGPRFIINFPTKQHWRNRSRLEDVAAGLEDLIHQVERHKIRSIAVPPLGSGNGKLDWHQVRPLIVDAFDALPQVRVLLYEPLEQAVPEDRVPSPKAPNMTLSSALMLKLMGLYRSEGYRLTMLEAQKLAYFLQEAGQVLKLNFKPSHYGPYAHNLNHVLRRLEGHWLKGAVDTSPNTELELLGEDRDEVIARVLDQNLQTHSNLAAVTRVIDGFETPHGMELLATVHWIGTHSPEAREDLEVCTRKVWQWSARKRKLMTAFHIKVAWERLDQLSWLMKTPMPEPSQAM